MASSSLWGCELKDHTNIRNRQSRCHPPCEDVSWKRSSIQDDARRICHPPCEDVSWKVSTVVGIVTSLPSSSLWGCELKDRYVVYRGKLCSHPPCEDVSWKIPDLVKIFQGGSHPPCEDVSWKTVLNPVAIGDVSHPPCEDVSWKARERLGWWSPISHPPCEDVSWKINDIAEWAREFESSSLWGCELKDKKWECKLEQI